MGRHFIINHFIVCLFVETTAQNLSPLCVIIVALWVVQFSYIITGGLWDQFHTSYISFSKIL